MNLPKSELSVAADFIRAQRPDFQPSLGLVLGSGLGGVVDAITILEAIPYEQIPSFPRSTVEGHQGRLVLGTLEGVAVAVMQGRVHLYEGYPPQQVIFPVRVLSALGVKTLIVTNAAGSVNPVFEAMELMVLRDHLNLTGTNGLLGPNDATLGPRFPDMSAAYDPVLRQMAHEVAQEQGIVLREGVYAGLLGPSYETPAEVRMLGILGADAVGMSTVLEVIAARHAGMRVLGLSAISNKGAGLSPTPLSHDEVKAAGDAMQSMTTKLIRGVVARLA